MLLSEVMEKSAKVLSLTIEINDLTKETIHLLQTLAYKHKGRCALRLRIQDYAENLTIDLPSRKYRINAGEMVRALQQLPQIEYKVTGE
jgi:DNA polymerase-3 subunit alpha